jgi:uncharacterized protein YndB with AHSA1/START domain
MLTSGSASRRTIILERMVRGSVEEVWELWTSKDGLESWWGPEGFDTKVRKLNVEVGGEFEYELTATDPDLRKGMEEAGLPLVSVAHGRFTEVIPRRRLAYTTIVDFAPGVAPYETKAVVELFPRGEAIRLVFTAEAMHNEEWTRLAHLGWSSQLDRLAARWPSSGPDHAARPP